MANIDVANGGDCQAAIDSAVGGDVIRLGAGASIFTGHFRLKAKGNTDYITIRTNVADASLPAADTRIDTSYSGTLARIQAAPGGLPAIQADAGAGFYRLLGLEFLPNPNGFSEIVRLGDNDTETPSYNDFQLDAAQPHHLEVDRCLIRGDAFQGQKRGIFANGKHITIKNCRIDRIFGVGQDSQAIAVMNAYGPIEITNNFLEAAAENFLTGGSDPVGYTFAQVATSPAPTTTSATLTSFRLGPNGVQHTISSQGPIVGHRIAIRISGGAAAHHAVVQTAVGNAITWTPASPVVPDSGTNSDIRWGINPVGITFRRNHVYKPVSWKNALLGTPGSVSATGNTTSGSLPPGTYYYRVQAVNDHGYNNDTYISDAAAQVQATIGLMGHVDLSWAAVANAEKYWVWGRSNNAPDRYFETTLTSFSDTGTAGTAGTLDASGSRPQVKNLFEIKSGENVQVDSNLMENSWEGVDIGLAVWLKVVNQDGQGRFVETKNVIFEKNWIRHIEGCLLLSGQEWEDGGNISKPPRMGSTVVRNNVFEDSTVVRTLNSGSSPHPLTINHNTFLHSNSSGDTAAVLFYGEHSFNLTFTNNLLRAMDYGVRTVDPVLGTLGEGTPSLNAIGGGYTFQKNVIQGASATDYPATNFFPTEAEFQDAFVDYAGGDFHIAPSHAYENAGTDGLDLGADIDLVLDAIAGVEDGDPEGGTPPPAGAIVWGNFINAAASGADLQKTGGSADTPNGAAISEQELTGDGYFEFTIPAMLEVQIGLGNDTGYDIDQMEHCLYIHDNVVELRHRLNGTYHDEHPAAAGDTFRITRTGSTIVFSRNGSTLTPTPALASSSGTKKLDVAIWTLSGQITDANLNGNTSPLTMALSGVSATGILGTVGVLLPLPPVPVGASYGYARLGGP